MKKALFTMLCVIAVFVLASSAGAEKGKTFSVTPFIGGYTFDGDEDLKTSLVYGLRLGYNLTDHWGLEGVFDYARADCSDAARPGVRANNYGYRLEALYNFTPVKLPFIPADRLIPFLAAGVGGRTIEFTSTDIGDRNQFVADYGFGLKYFLTDNLALRGDVRHIIPFNDELNNLEYTIGLTYLFGGGAAAPVALAEKVVLDSDHDGVADNLDKCPGTPLGVKVDKKGCPLDSDNDGVADYLDKCPGTPSGVKVDEDGCPLDSDKDGVADYLDKCPGTPSGVKVDEDGCPLDSDKDGVADYLDKCPGTPLGVKVDKDGCPPPVMIEQKREAQAAPVVKEKVAVALNVEFDTAKAVVKKEYQGEIKKVADFMKEYPLTKAVIEGHTDNVGREAYNVKLSQARANSVRKCLIDKYGIDGSRLKAVGYGESKPIASNATKAGKQKNRRVEAVIETMVEK